MTIFTCQTKKRYAAGIPADINGIAIGVIELKHRISIGDGIRQNEEKYSMSWKEDEQDDTRFKLDRYLLKICAKDPLIELMHDFVLFDGGMKKLPRVHRYFGINPTGGIAVDVVKKDIKYVHLSVYPPTGKVRISAPLRMDLSTIRLFAIAKLGWIRQQQKKVNEQERETPREYLDRESHYLWEKRYLLKVIEKDAPPSVELKHSRLLLQIRPGSNEEKKRAILDEWYRQQLKEAVPPVIAKWEPLICA